MLSTEDLQRIYEAAGSVNATARLLNKPRTTVLMLLKRSGISLKPRGPHPQSANHPWVHQPGR